MGCAGLSFLLAALALELWNADLTVPLDDGGGDVSSVLMAAKGVFQNGWFLVNDHLAAPFGQDMRDYPTYSVWNLHFGAVKALGLFTSSPVAAVNVYFLLTFPLAGIAAFLFFRRLEVSPPSAAVCAVLFAVLPYHFARGEAHLGQAAYFVVPAGAYLAVAIFSGWPLFARRASGPAWLRWASRETLLTLAFCILLALADEYFSAFTIILVIVAAAVRAIGERRPRPFGVAALVVVAIGAIFALQLTPTIVYRLEHGPNPAGVGAREPEESEIYSTTLARLVLPARGDHPVGFVDEIADRYWGTTPIPGDAGGAQLGLIPTVGFLLLLALPVLAVASAGRLPGLLADIRIRQAAGATLVLLLLGTTGGLSALIANLLTPQLRSWQRVTIFIALFSLLAVALLLDRTKLALAPRRHGRPLFIGLLALVLVFGFLDQAGPYFGPDYRAEREARDSRAALVDTVEERIPDGEVLQLPPEQFPEWSDPRIPRQEYDSALPYLDSETLDWSYGGITGRPEDWVGSQAGAPPEYLVTTAAAAGFEGAWIDLAAYADSAGQVEAGIARLAGSNPLRSTDGRYSFFQLSGLDRRLRALVPQARWQESHDAALHPPVPTWGGGFADEEVTEEGRFYRAWDEATLEFENPLAVGRRLVLEADVEASQAPSRLTLTLPDGGRRTVQITGTTASIAIPFEAPPGESEMGFAIEDLQVPEGGGAGDLEFRLIDPSVLDPRWVQLSRLRGPVVGG
jgi:phosphoglycerol transferase